MTYDELQGNARLVCCLFCRCETYATHAFLGLAWRHSCQR